MTVDLPGPPLRIAVLGDFDGAHTRRWLRVFVERGHKVHAISYYRPAAELPGVRLHVLRDQPAPSGKGGAAAQSAKLRDRLPPTFLRLLNALRYRRAGLKRALSEIAPDVFHAHYVVEHGFYGSFAGFHPYVVSAWGSDLFVASRTPLGGLLARWTLRRADLVTANDPALRERAVRLGATPSRVAVIRLGIDRTFLEGPPSINLDASNSTPPTVFSDRALEPVYDVGRVIRAFGLLRERLPDAQLIVANDGSERVRLESLAQALGLGAAVRFVGRIEPIALRDALARAHVYVSVPTSDSLSLSTMEAMAAGAFPVVSDLVSQDWIESGVNGLRVQAGEPHLLADTLYTALTNNDMRRSAVAPNRARVEAEGLTETNMLAMERLYYDLVGRRASLRTTPQGD